MNKNALTIIYLLVMIATVVVLDILFFKHKFWERLVANIIIAFVYVALYFFLFKKR